MAYSLYDISGYVAPLATVTGFKDLAEFLSEFTLPTATAFLENGYTEDPGLLSEELKFIEPLCNNKSVISTLNDLVASLAKCDTIAIVSD